MDSDLSSSMMLFRILPAATAVVSILVTLTLFGPMVLYVLARWRAHRVPVADPHLGLKFALHWFATSAFHLALVGAAILIFTIIGPGRSSAKGEMFRAAFAMLVPAGIVLGVHLMLLRRTNDDEVPGVRRLFLGYNMIITGLVGFIALATGFQLLFAKGGSTQGMGHMAGSAILVYGGAWAALGFRFGQLVLGGASGLGAYPEVVPPGRSEPPPPRASAAGGGAGLPPLGGGAYPPLDR
jgi:hypothetical protein